MSSSLDFRFVLSLLAACVVLFQCTFSSESSVRIRVSAERKSRPGALDFDCYFVGVTAPDIRNSTAASSEVSQTLIDCLDLGLVSVPIERDKLISEGASVTVRRGSSRRIALYGLNTTPPASCAGKPLSDLPLSWGSSKIYELGSATRDLFSSQEVEILDAYGSGANALEKIYACGSSGNKGLVLNLDPKTADNGNPPVSNPSCLPLTWKDSSGFGNNGTLQNFISCTTYGWQGNGTSGDPYRFVFGGSGWVRVARTSQLEPAAGLSIEAWVRGTTPSPDAHVVSKFDSQSQDAAYALYQGASGIGFYIKVGGQKYLSRDANVWDSQWHHVVGTYDNAAISIYVDGTLLRSDPVSGPLSYSNDDLIIGNYMPSGTKPYLGDLGAVAIYNRALTSSEVQANCSTLSPRFLGASCASSR